MAIPPENTQSHQNSCWCLRLATPSLEWFQKNQVPKEARSLFPPQAWPRPGHGVVGCVRQGFLFLPRLGTRVWDPIRQTNSSILLTPNPSPSETEDPLCNARAQGAGHTTFHGEQIRQESKDPMPFHGTPWSSVSSGTHTHTHTHTAFSHAYTLLECNLVSSWPRAVCGLCWPGCPATS